MNTSRIENPEIIAKLMQPDPEFTDVEWVQALYTELETMSYLFRAVQKIQAGSRHATTTISLVLADYAQRCLARPGYQPALGRDGELDA